MRRSEWPRQGPRTRACSRTGPLLSPGRPPQPLLNSPVGLAAAACCLCAVCALSGRAEHITFTAHAGRVAPHPVASSARPEGCCSSCTLLTRALLFFQCTHAAGCAKCCSCAASALSGRSEHTLETAHAGGAAPYPLACVAPLVWRCRSLRPLEHAPRLFTAQAGACECCSCAASALCGRSEHTVETPRAGRAAPRPPPSVASLMRDRRSIRRLHPRARQDPTGAHVTLRDSTGPHPPDLSAPADASRWSHVRRWSIRSTSMRAPPGGGPRHERLKVRRRLPTIVTTRPSSLQFVPSCWDG